MTKHRNKSFLFALLFTAACAGIAIIVLTIVKLVTLFTCT
jgi:hypothetical protein